MNTHLPSFAGPGKTHLFIPMPCKYGTFQKASNMIKILLVEDNPSLIRMYKDAFAVLMPEARVSIVTSFGGFLGTAADMRYDAYILDDRVADGRAFWDIAPMIQGKFQDAILLHNSSNTDEDYIRKVERIAKIRFARRPDGSVITCGKRIEIAIEALRSMVVGREEKMQKPAFESSPACQSTRPNIEPKRAFLCKL